MRLRLPATVQGQIIAILIGALPAALALVATLLTLTRPPEPPLPHGPWPDARRIAAIIEALHAARAEDRAKIAAAVSTTQIRVHVGEPVACTRLAPAHETGELQFILAREIADRVGPFTVTRCAAEPGVDGESLVAFPRDDTRVSITRERPPNFPHMMALPLIVGLSFLLTVVVALSAWAVVRVSRPLRQLAANVEQFELDIAVAPLSEKGPLEIRQVAQSFNRMQERIARSVEERRRMLLAIGHDLRTPLTRLKLRIDMDDASAKRPYLLRDVQLMHRMVNGALTFLVDHSDGEAVERVDLGALVESICIEFTEAGEEVAYSGAYGLECQCQPTAVMRAVSNLIENGCRYGKDVCASVRRENELAVIEVEDKGPGIPPDMRQQVLAPFVRLDKARRADGSLGLGLSIVQEVARRHCGDLRLFDAVPHGLLVRLVLPLAAPDELAAGGPQEFAGDTPPAL